MSRSKAPDFASARDLAEATHLCEEQVRREIECLRQDLEPGEADGLDSLTAWAESARRARSLYRSRYTERLARIEQRIRAATVESLRDADLHEFAAALESGDYTGLEF